MSCPACYPPMTQVSFQHPVAGLIRGVISGIDYTIDTNELIYIVNVNCPNRGFAQYMVYPCNINVI
jgi:hypothetical protein